MYNYKRRSISAVSASPKHLLVILITRDGMNVPSFDAPASLITRIEILWIAYGVNFMCEHFF